MTRLEKLYLNWLASSVCNVDEKQLYSSLLEYLFSKEYVWYYDLDENTYIHGLELRESFLNLSPERRKMDIYGDFVNKPCSILEVMVYLSRKIEDSIMSNSQFGDRTKYWFWLMIENLGLKSMENGYFDEIKCDKIIEKFLNHEYKRDGKGSLFAIKDKKIDMRELTIWSQCMSFLTEFAKNDQEL